MGILREVWLRFNRKPCIADVVPIRLGIAYVKKIFLFFHCHFDFLK